MGDYNFDWKPDLNTNIEIIDIHHQQLFKIGRDVEQLIQIKCIGVTDEQLLDIVCQLREYTGYHFYEEEWLMSEYNYPKLEEHREKHKEYLDKIMQISMPALKESPEKELRKIKAQIKDALFNHILIDDMEMAKFILEKKKEQGVIGETATKSHDEFESMYGSKICNLDVTSVYLYKDQKFKGRVVLVYRDKAKDLFRLSALERNMFFSDMARIAKAIKKLYEPQTFDYASYGDVEERVHLHVVPKYEGQPGFGVPFSLVTKESEAVYLTAEETEQMVKEIQKELK